LNQAEIFLAHRSVTYESGLHLDEAMVKPQLQDSLHSAGR